MPTFLLPPLNEFCAWASVMPASRIESGAYFSAPIAFAWSRTCWAWTTWIGSLPVYFMVPICGLPTAGGATKPENVIGVLLPFFGGIAMDVKQTSSEGRSTRL